jgi:hypothetical protein
MPHLAAARRAGWRQLRLALLEVPQGVAAGEADGDPIAESLPPLLPEPVGGFAHQR